MVRQRGFSLVEVMVVIAILGILMSIAAPAATEWVASQRVRDTAFDIHASLMRARNEAISRGLAVTVMPGVPGDTGNWADGWYVANPDATYNPDMDNPTVFIEQHGPVQNATITGGAITFTAVGRLQGGGATSMKLTVDGTNLARCITVDTAGRAKTLSISASDSCP